MKTTTENTQKWHWQFDPLDTSGSVQIVNEDGVILAEVASIKSAGYIIHRLNSFDELQEACNAALILTNCMGPGNHTITLGGKDIDVGKLLRKIIAKATQP